MTAAAAPTDDNSGEADAATAAAPPSAPAPSTATAVDDAPPAALAIATAPAKLIKNLSILPPRQKKANPSSSSSSPLPETPVALPPLRVEEPVASLRAALSELIGYAALTRYRFVVERLAERNDDASAAAAKKKGGAANNGNNNAAVSSSNHNSNNNHHHGGSKKRGGKGGGHKGGGHRHRKGHSSSSSEEAPCHSPFALGGAEVSSPPSHGGAMMADGGPRLSSSNNNNELALDDYGDLASLVALLENKGDAASSNDESTAEDPSHNDSAAAPPSINTAAITERGIELDASRIALRVVLAPYDAASVREQVGRVRALLGGNAPCVASLVEGEGEEEEGGEEMAAAVAKEALVGGEASHDKNGAEGGKQQGAKDAPETKKEGDDAKPRQPKKEVDLAPLPSGHDLRFEKSAGAGDLSHFYRFACGDEGATKESTHNGDAEPKKENGSTAKKSKSSSKSKSGTSVTDADLDALVAAADVPSMVEIERILHDLHASARVSATIRFSDHHPPPPHRRVLGDLAYLECTLPDGASCHVTAFSLGFYVNKSTSDGAFDPAPVRTDPVEACYSHSLLDCLLQRSKPLRAAWRTALAAARRRSELAARLAILESAPAGLLRTATSPYGDNGPGVGPGGTMAPAPSTFVPRMDGASARPPWLVPLPAVLRDGRRTANENDDDDERRASTFHHSALHASDPYRAEEEWATAYGPSSDVGMRDWNEELQAAREMPVENLQDRIERARVIHKILTDFGDAALRGVRAIVDGRILPMNPAEPPRSHVHLHDNIFFSRALDPGPDTFKIHQGDGAARKTASRDAHNVGVLHRLDVPGLHTLAVVLVEYAGMRLVCQSIVPGILHGEKAHTLLCGAVETLSALRCDDEMHTLLEASLGESCMVATRNVPAHPLTDERMEVLRRHRIDSPDPLMGADDAKKGDEDLKDTSVQVCGPVEMKGIRGSDGRKYVLDCTRLTPRDANWVDAADGGTGKWEELRSKENGAAKSDLVPPALDDDEWTACVLRPELVTKYAEMKIGQFLKESSAKSSGGGGEKEGETEAAEKKEEDEDAEKDDATPAAPVDEKEWVDISAKKAAEQSKEEVNDSTTAASVPNKVEEEYIRSLRYNVNVFLPFTRSIEIIDAESHAELKKDEEEVRNIARHLWDVVLPTLTNDIRRCSANGLQLPAEGKTLTDLMHTRGINCRYLGRLAALARKEEAEDIVAAKRAETAWAVARKLGDAVDKPKMEKITAPRFRMPLCWLEQLECEMAARAAKHVLDSYLTESRGTMGPRPVAQTVASFLSAVVSRGEESAAETETRTSKNDANVLDPDEVSALSLFDLSIGGNDDAAAARGRDEVWADIEREVGRRYRYTLSLYNVHKKDGGDGGRALYIPLLRRICQRSGIRLVAKQYDLGKKCVCGGGGGLAASYPIAPTDILDVLPLVKHGASVADESFVPSHFGANGFSAHWLHVLLPEAETAFKLGHANMASGNTSVAAECAQEASAMYQRVVDTPVHPQVSGCLRLLAAARIHGTDDVGPALATAERFLSVSVSLHGFDSSEVLRARLQIVDILLGVGKVSEAVKQIRAAQYLMELLGGRNYAGLASSYYRLGTIFFEAGNPEDALRCFRAAAKCRCEDRIFECLVARNTSGVLCRMGLFKPAFEFEKKAHELYATILGEEHDATRQCANTLIQLMNLAIEQDKQLKNQEKERQKEQAANDAAEAIRADEEQKAETAKPKKRKNKKKKGKK